VQVDPIKPMLKPPGTKRLTLKCEEPLSSFAFKSKLRRYSMDEDIEDVPEGDALKGNSDNQFKSLVTALASRLHKQVTTQPGTPTPEP